MEENFDYEYRLKDVFFPCIYFLLKNEKVVYIGQTEYGLKRILCHVTDKHFDTIKILKCDKEHLNEIETELIAKYQPNYNKSLTNAISVTRIKQLLIKIGYRVRKNVIKRWVLEHAKKHYVFCEEIYIPEKEKEETLRGIIKSQNLDKQ